MTGKLEGKIAVVTGSNSGIGRAIAVAYGREGATVICANRQAESKHPDEKISTNDLIVKNGGKAEFLPLQFSDSKSIDSLIEKVVEKYGRIDAWVNNAGTGGVFKSIHEMTDEDFDQAIDVNLKGNFRCIRSVSAQMVKQNGGSIINTCSVFGPRGWWASSSYSASKSGTMGMIRAAAMDLSPYKVRVNAISPGTVMTGMLDGQPDEVMDALKRKAMLGFGKPEDIAGTAVLLASDEGRWIQGQEIFVDGGFTL